jgi:hypothetical protein
MNNLVWPFINYFGTGRPLSISPHIILIIAEMEKVTFSYNRISSLLFTILPLGIIALSVPNLLKFINEHDTINWFLIVLFDFCFLLIVIYIIIKQLIPSLQGKVAFEIDAIGITSYTKNVIIKWGDIKTIELGSGQTSSSLYITFK